MRRLSLCALVPFLLSGALLPGAQDPSADLTSLLRERVRAAAELHGEAMWDEAGTLAELGLAFEGDAFDRAVDDLLGEDGRGQREVLLLIATRLEGDEPPYEDLAAHLEHLLGSDDEEVVRGAAGLLADGDFTQLPGERAEALVTALLDGARDGDLAPETRLDLAQAAWARGGGREKRAARAEMRAFLDSAEPRLRGLAALALASIGDLETGRGELERLSELPGPAGRLAEAYLKLEQKSEYYESKLRAQREKLLEAMNGDAPHSDLDRIERLIELIQTNHIEGDHAEREKLLDAAMQGMLSSLDRHSAYLPPSYFETFQQDLSGEYGGIGAYVNVDPDDQLFTISRPIYSGPAYRADLRTDDKIVRIGDWPTIENGHAKDLEEIIKKLKGRPGTTAKLYIWRRGMDPALIERPTEDMAVVVERELITIPPVNALMLPGQLALVELSTFSGVASQELERALAWALSQGARGVVLDLRNNPGGLLPEACDVADLFLPRRKTVVKTESRVQAPREFRTRKPAFVPEDVPVAVLINRFSASASEIVSGALQDHGRATLVGQTSFGKGSVQELVTMPGEEDDQFRDENGNHRHDNWEPITVDHDGDGEFDWAPRVKLTVSRYLLPSGRSIHRELDDDGNLVSMGGIEPDIEVEPRRWDAWRLEEVRRIRADGTLREWVEERWPTDQELFSELALCDHDDTSRYRGFDELYDRLDTPLPKEDVRILLRMEVRRRVQDERGQAFPTGDYEEDHQLQKAIQVVLGQLDESPYEFSEYKDTFDLDEIVSTGGPTIVRRDEGKERGELHDALALLAQVRRGEGELTPENLEMIRGLLEELDHE